MELVRELVFTAFFALLFSFLVAKLVSFAMAGAAGSSASASASGSVVEELEDVDADDATVEESKFLDKMNVGILECQKGVEFVQEVTVERVDKFDEVTVGLPKDDSKTGEDDSVEETVDTELALNEDVNVIEESEDIKEVGKDSNDGLVRSDDDDWEGIERSELELVFATAVKFVEELFGNNKDHLLSDVQMELYALHKIATEGPCRDAQPKWNARQNVGNMNPDEAMEQYVTLLSERVPGWMEKNYRMDDKLESEEIERADAVVAPADTSSLTGDQTDHTHERNEGLKSGSEGADLTGASSS